LENNFELIRLITKGDKIAFSKRLESVGKSNVRDFAKNNLRRRARRIVCTDLTDQTDLNRFFLIAYTYFA